jgi:hypothetical protein
LFQKRAVVCNRSTAVVFPGAEFIPGLKGIDSLLGLQLAGMPRDPILEAESTPLLEIVRQSDDIAIALEKLRGRRPYSPPKEPSLFSLPSLYHFEETTATQQANMLIAIKLHMPLDVSGSELLPFR